MYTGISVPHHRKRPPSPVMRGRLRGIDQMTRFTLSVIYV